MTGHATHTKPPIISVQFNSTGCAGDRSGVGVKRQLLGPPVRRPLPSCFLLGRVHLLIDDIDDDDQTNHVPAARLLRAAVPAPALRPRPRRRRRRRRRRQRHGHPRRGWRQALLPLPASWRRPRRRSRSRGEPSPGLRDAQPGFVGLARGGSGGGGGGC